MTSNILQYSSDKDGGLVAAEFLIFRRTIRNPFSRHSAPKKSVVSRATERDIEREVKKIERLEETSKKLYKDTKRWIESNNALCNSEHKITQDLLSSQLCQTEPELRTAITDWDQAVEKQEQYMKELCSNAQRTVGDPMKKYNSIFPSVQTAIKKREQSLQEYMKCQARLEKHQDKERTGQNVVKLDTSRKALNKSKEDFENQNQALVEDLPKFVDNRIEYFQPCMDSLIKSEVTYNSEVYRVYTELADRMNKNNDKTTDQARGRIQQSLAEIKALSITVDD